MFPDLSLAAFRAAPSIVPFIFEAFNSWGEPRALALSVVKDYLGPSQILNKAYPDRNCYCSGQTVLWPSG